MDPDELLEILNKRQYEAALDAIGKRLDAADLERFLQCVTHTRARVFGIERLDANETAIFGQQLEVISTRLRETKHPELKWRSFVPVTSEVPRGAESWTYMVWDAVGMAEIIANYSDDVRKVAVTAKKFSYGIDGYALGYDWSLLDVDRAAMQGVNHRNRKADQVRRGFELRFEQLAATGRPPSSTGLVNNVNVPVMAAASVGGSSVWGSAGKSPEDVLNDLLAMEDAIVTTTKGVEEPDALLLPLDKFRYIQKTALFSGAGSDPKETILRVFLERAQSVRGIDWWHQLAKADAGGTGPRALMYKRDPEHVHLEMPKPPQEQPPQVKNLAIEVISESRIGGVVWEYPLSAIYCDGI